MYDGIEIADGAPLENPLIPVLRLDHVDGPRWADLPDGMLTADFRRADRQHDQHACDSRYDVIALLAL